MTRRRSVSVPASSWLTTYSDLVTLLLCFFVLLYSFSALDVDKFRRFIASFQGQGILDGGAVPDTSSPVPKDQIGDTSTHVTGPYYADSGRLLQHVQEYLEAHGIEAMVYAYREAEGVMLELRDHLLFDSGRADLRPEGRGLLDKLGNMLADFPNKVSIEGHTDNIPINTLEYPTNWELSGARAARVVRYLTEIRGLKPERFAAIGYGEFRPVASNVTSEGRAKNRRVVLVIKQL